MNREQFERAIYQGLGRPILYAQHHGTTPFYDLFLFACRYNLVYDPQINFDRADYLFDLISATGDADYFRRQLLADLSDPDDEMDEQQLFELAVRFARQGDAEARRVIYAHFIDNVSCGDTIGYEQIIALDRAEGHLFVIEQIGAALRRVVTFDDDDFPARLVEDLEQDLVTAGMSPEAVQERLTDERVIAFQQEAAARWHRDEADITASRAAFAEGRRLVNNLAALNYPQVRQYAAQKLVRFHNLQRWGTSATDADLLLAARDLLASDDPQEQSRLLFIFGARPFPLGHAPLLPLLKSSDRLVSWRAAWALGQIVHPEVRTLALDMLATNHMPEHALRLLVSNYQPGDYLLLEDLVRRQGDDDDLHAIAYGVDDIFERNPSPDAVGVLLYLYEHGPCATCRAEVVSQLLRLDALPAELAAECRYDAHSRTRQRIQPEQT